MDLRASDTVGLQTWQLEKKHSALLVENVISTPIFQLLESQFRDAIFCPVAPRFLLVVFWQENLRSQLRRQNEETQRLSEDAQVH